MAFMEWYRGSSVGGGKGLPHLQSPLAETQLEHHAVAPHADLLTAWVQGVDAHGDCRPGRKQVKPHTGQCVHLLSLKSLTICCPFPVCSLYPSHSYFRLGRASPLCVLCSYVSRNIGLTLLHLPCPFPALFCALQADPMACNSQACWPFAVWLASANGRHQRGWEERKVRYFFNPHSLLP